MLFKGSSYDLSRIGFYDCRIRKLKKAASDYLFKKVADSKEEEIIRSRLESLKYISPVCYYVAFPNRLSEVLEEVNNYFGVKTSCNKGFIHDRLIYRIEKIAKFKYINILDGEEMSVVPLDKV